MTFDTLLIANRGEIAVRVIRTARELGLRTVAVYSDADRSAPHVRLADEAVRLGPAPAKESYLDADLVLKAAKDTGAGAIHPGYGFLSEDAAFARRCEDAGIVFVGPTPAQLDLFGAKHTARAAAEAAGVQLAPGTGLLADLDEALTQAALIDYPVMLKATGGGGGIGMSACHSPAELTESWERVQRVAAASFSSAGVFLERLVEHARHVEVQVFGDGEGKVVTFGDRDCSLQRRNQKVVEEAPHRASPTTSAPDWPPPLATCAPRSATAPPAPSSSSTTRPARRPTSWRSTPASRWNIRSPRRSTASTWSPGCCAWPRANPTSSATPAPRAATPSRPASTPRTRPANTGPARAC